MTTLEKIAQKHKDWLRIVKSFGCKNEYCEDIVQQMYLKCHTLITNGTDISYGDEINHTSETEEELRDETNPNEYEENRNKIKYMERTEDLKEVTTDEEEFRKWEGIDEDWQEFNRKNNEKDK